LQLDLHVEARPAHVDLDREIGQLSRLPPEEWLSAEGWFSLVIMLDRYGPVPHVIEGALAALIHGAPVPVDEAGPAVVRADLAVFESWLRRTGATAWDEERKVYEDRYVDLRLYDTMRWQTAFGPIIVRFCDREPSAMR
jgi:hypothetical protein